MEEKCRSNVGIDGTRAPVGAFDRGAKQQRAENGSPKHEQQHPLHNKMLDPEHARDNQRSKAALKTLEKRDGDP
jgi:hypothetical protein